MFFVSELVVCEECGTPLEVDRLGGVCPACLLLGAAAVEEGGTGTGLGWLGGHELLELLAQGGMGTVYRARQKAPEREVALKALPGAALLSAAARARFQDEAQAMAALEHPGILPVYELGEQDGTPFFTMKLAAGGTLAQRTRDYAGKWREIAELLAHVAEAVQFAHERGVLHRDLKPGNILFDEEGRAYVSDFGLAKLEAGGAGVTRPLEWMGTPHYMAPETLGGKGVPATTAGDVWSLGVILYELLAQRRPFEGESLPAVLRQVVEQEPPMPSGGVPRDLGVIALKALAKSPAQRYVGARELADDLRRWLRGEPILARPVPLLERAALFARRRPALTAAWVVVALPLAGSAALLMQSQRRLRGALENSRQLEADARENLRDSLIVQARLLRQSHLPGRRLETLGLLERAAALGPFAGLRDEAVAALACDDVRRAGVLFDFQTHASSSRAVAVTPDFRLMLGRGTDGTTGLREVATGEWLWRDGSKRATPARDFHLTADGRFAGIVSEAREAEMWDTGSGSLLAREKLIAKDTRFLAESVPFTLHESRPLAAGVDAAGTLWVRDLESGGRVELARGLQIATALALNAEGTRLAAGAGDQIEIWDIEEKRQVLQHKVRDSGHAMAWDGPVLIISDRSSKETVILDKDQRTSRFNRHRNIAWSVAPLPGTNLTVTLSTLGQATVWQRFDGQPVCDLACGTGLLAAHESGRSLLVEEQPGRAVRWELAPSRVFREWVTGRSLRFVATMGMVLSPDGRLLATLGNHTLGLWDARRGRLLYLWLLPDEGTSLQAAFSPDGRFLVASTDRGGIWRRGLRLDEAGELTLGAPEKVPGGEALAFRRAAPDGRTWAVLDAERRLCLWEPGAGKPPRPYRAEEWAAAGGARDLPRADPLPPVEVAGLLAGSGNGPDYLAPGEQRLFRAAAGMIRLYDTAEGKELLAWPDATGPGVTATAAVSPDGRLAAIEGREDSFDLIVLPEGRRLLRLTPPVGIDAQSACFSADGSSLMILGSGQRLFEWRLRELREELERMGLGEVE